MMRGALGFFRLSELMQHFNFEAFKFTIKKGKDAPPFRRFSRLIISIQALLFKIEFKMIVLLVFGVFPVSCPNGPASFLGVISFFDFLGFHASSFAFPSISCLGNKSLFHNHLDWFKFYLLIRPVADLQLTSNSRLSQ